MNKQIRLIEGVRSKTKLKRETKREIVGIRPHKDWVKKNSQISVETQPENQKRKRRTHSG